jgi:peptide/nickel transport system permease protein
MGRYIVTAIMSIDYPVIMGVTILATGVYVVVNMIIDILQAFIDPRIRLE